MHDANDGAAYTTPALAFDVLAFCAGLLSDPNFTIVVTFGVIAFPTRSGLSKKKSHVLGTFDRVCECEARRRMGKSPDFPPLDAGPTRSVGVEPTKTFILGAMVHRERAR